MADKLMYSPNDDTQKLMVLKHFDTQINELTNQTSIKVPKVV